MSEETQTQFRLDFKISFKKNKIRVSNSFVVQIMGLSSQHHWFKFHNHKDAIVGLMSKAFNSQLL